MPESTELSQGLKAFEQIKAKEKETTNKALAQQITAIGKKIAAVSGRPDYKWEFKTFENDTPNAFCLPGGKVGIYTGILKYAQNEAGLATVMGHEIGHALARHGGQRMSEQLGAGVLVAGVGLATRQYTKSNKDALMAALGAGVTVGILLPFSRSHETEADEIGIMLMAKAGYDPREASRFWQRFSAASKGKKPPEFLSTHPRDDKRATHLAELESQALVDYNKVQHKIGLGKKLKYQ